MGNARKLSKLLVAVISLLMAPFSYADPAEDKNVSVMFLGPPFGESAFWDKLMAPMPLHARRLSIDFRFVFVPFDNRFDYLETAKKLISQSNRPDYLITMFRGATAIPLLELAEENHVNLITINSPIPPAESELIGQPGQRYSRWIGEIYYDDVDVGYQLADKLVKIGKQRVTNLPLTMVALAGDNVLQTSHHRHSGLVSRIDGDKDVEFLQRVTADWNRQKAAQLIQGLYERYPRIDLIWAANDDIALGAADGLAAMGVRPDSLSYPVIGGVDATVEGLAGIKAGRFAITFSGNEQQGVHALDYVSQLIRNNNVPYSRTLIYSFSPVSLP